MRKNIEILNILQDMYPQAEAELHFSTPYECLVATILSAQCTDKQVNKVTPSLFERYPDAQALANADMEELQNIIRSCGFFRSKAQHLLQAANRIVADYHGQVPSTLEELQTLEGVGRKTANVVFANAFGGDAIAVDTHVHRVSNRLGLADAKTPQKTELQLRVAIPQSMWSHAHHLIIWHGRRMCHARKPECGVCPLLKLCKYGKAHEKDLEKGKKGY